MYNPTHPDHRRPRLLLLIMAGLAFSLSIQAAHPISRYDVLWHAPSKDASGQMPLGNGDIAAGVYAIEGDALYLLLAKNDAYTYNGDIFKTGGVKIDLRPNPFIKGKPFLQRLNLATGAVLIEAADVRIRVWADALHPVVSR